MVSPTVYDGAVLVSGGFRSKELYAYEAKTGEPRWALDLGDDGPSSVACEQGVCVLSTESCTLFAVDARTGAHLWSHWLGDPLTSAPTLAGGRVFASYPATTTSDGKPKPPDASHALATFDLRTGTLGWQHWLDSDVMSAPVAVGASVYAATFAGTIVKLDQQSGDVHYATRARATAAPVIAFGEGGLEETYYTRRADGAAPGSVVGDAAREALKSLGYLGGETPAKALETLIRTDHNDPETRYATGTKAAPHVDAEVQESSDKAMSSAQDDAANGFGGGAPAAANAQAAWDNVGVRSVSSMQGFQGSRVVKIGDRVANTMGDEVVATDADTGEILWRHALSGNLTGSGGALASAPLAAGGSILVGTLAGEVVRLDPANGEVQARWSVGAPVRSQPVVHDGWIYVGTEDGRLVALDTGDRTLTGWSTWGGDAQRSGVVPAK
jgi:outer membrane protein assembly factor BamB